MDYTYLSIQQKRGHLGMDAIGILPNFQGIAVHDCWASYWKYPNVEHDICCAHLLRELNGVIENHPEQVCLFINNLCVPFDNNQAERDLRMIKVKTKVSGCFRSKEGAQEYLAIMSYIGTAHKHGINAFTAIKEALDGNADIIFG